MQWGAIPSQWAESDEDTAHQCITASTCEDKKSLHIESLLELLLSGEDWSRSVQTSGLIENHNKNHDVASVPSVSVAPTASIATPAVADRGAGEHQHILETMGCLWRGVEGHVCQRWRGQLATAGRPSVRSGFRGNQLGRDLVQLAILLFRTLLSGCDGGQQRTQRLRHGMDGGLQVHLLTGNVRLPLHTGTVE